MFDEMLKSAGLDPRSLSDEEVKTLESWADQYNKTTLTLSDVEEYLSSMIEAVSRELAGYKPPETISFFLFRRKRERYLKARLYNLITLREFIRRPSRMLEAIKKSLHAKKKVLQNNNYGQ